MYCHRFIWFYPYYRVTYHYPYSVDKETEVEKYHNMCKIVFFIGLLIAVSVWPPRSWPLTLSSVTAPIPAPTWIFYANLSWSHLYTQFTEIFIWLITLHSTWSEITLCSLISFLKTPHIITEYKHVKWYRNSKYTYWLSLLSIQWRGWGNEICKFQIG